MAERITIIGAGPVGSLLAVFLGRRGMEVDVLERSPDPRVTTVKNDRSICMSVNARGVRALRRAGLAEKIMAMTIPMPGRIVHHAGGKVETQPYGVSPEEALHAVHRTSLNCALLDAAEALPGVRLHFEQEVGAIHFHGGTMESNQKMAPLPRPLFGADGAYSAVRASMMRRAPFNFRQEHLEYGYKDVDVPAGPNGEYQLEPHGLHIWPRHKFMLIALPKPDGSFAAELFMPIEGLSALDTAPKVEAFFREHFPDVFPLHRNLGKDFLAFPVGHLVSTEAFPWNLGGEALLVGDAAHAVVPFFGEGMNCGFEDVHVLDDCIEAHGADRAAVFERFVRLRKPQTDAICAMALENFVEMRDQIEDSDFDIRKSAEHLLEVSFPGRFIGRHGLVAIHGVPYLDARRAGPVLDHVLDAVCQGKTSVDEVDLGFAENLVDEQVAPLVRAMLPRGGAQS